MGPAAAQAHPANHFVHQAPDLPKRIGIVPSVTATNGPNIVKGFFRIVHLQGFFILQTAVFRHLNIFLKIRDSSGGQRILPTGNDQVLFYFIEGLFYGFPITQWLYSQYLLQFIIACHYFHFHAVNQVYGQFIGGGGYKIQPVGRKPRRHDRNRYDPKLQTTDLGILPQHILIGQYVWPANVKGPVKTFLPIQNPGKKCNNVTYGDGLYFCFEPLGRDHYGQFFAEITNDFKRRAAASHHDART